MHSRHLRQHLASPHLAFVPAWPMQPDQKTTSHQNSFKTFHTVKYDWPDDWRCNNCLLHTVLLCDRLSVSMKTSDSVNEAPTPPQCLIYSVSRIGSAAPWLKMCSGHFWTHPIDPTNLIIKALHSNNAWSFGGTALFGPVCDRSMCTRACVW